MFIYWDKWLNWTGWCFCVWGGVGWSFFRSSLLYYFSNTSVVQCVGFTTPPHLPLFVCWKSCLLLAFVCRAPVEPTSRLHPWSTAQVLRRTIFLTSFLVLSVASFLPPSPLCAPTTCPLSHLPSLSHPSLLFSPHTSFTSFCLIIFIYIVSSLILYLLLDINLFESTPGSNLDSQL